MDNSLIEKYNNSSDAKYCGKEYSLIDELWQERIADLTNIDELYKECVNLEPVGQVLVVHELIRTSREKELYDLLRQGVIGIGLNHVIDRYCQEIVCLKPRLDLEACGYYLFKMFDVYYKSFTMIPYEEGLPKGREIEANKTINDALEKIKSRRIGKLN